MDKRKIFLVSLGILVLAGLPSFIEYASVFITGQVEAMVIQNRWDLVGLNILLFLIFLIPLNFRKKVNWKSMGIYAAFIVSLFVEMYGIPLTIYLSSTVAVSGGASQTTLDPFLTFTVLGQTFSMPFWKIIGAAISITGMLTIIVGWVTIYKKSQKVDLVTSGIYKYSRHPQYLGIILISLGWFVHWPTMLTLGMLPILIYFYYRLTEEEEEELMDEFEDPTIYEEYREDTPRFI